MESTLKRGAELDDENISSSSSSAESECESSGPTKAEEPAKKASIRKKATKGAKAKDKSHPDEDPKLINTVEVNPAAVAADAIKIPRVETEESSADEVTEITPNNRESHHSTVTGPDTASVKDTNLSHKEETTNKPNQEVVKKSSSTMQRRRSSILHKVALSRNHSNMSMGSTIQEGAEGQEGGISSVADAAKAAMPTKPKMTGDNLPKMVDFLPDIRARIEMLKKPLKGAKNKKKVDEQEQDQHQTGG